MFVGPKYPRVERDRETHFCADIPECPFMTSKLLAVVKRNCTTWNFQPIQYRDHRIGKPIRDTVVKTAHQQKRGHSQNHSHQDAIVVPADDRVTLVVPDSDTEIDGLCPFRNVKLGRNDTTPSLRPNHKILFLLK